MLGADGFIGSAVVRAALTANASVVGICLREPWRLDGTNDARLRLVEVPDGRWWVAGYRDEFGRVVAGADSLALLAYEYPGARPDDERLHHERTVNAAGAAGVAKVATVLGVRVVFASSADVYGPWHDDPVAEDRTAAPATPYARAKLEAEHMLEDQSPDGGLVSLRIATVFGPGENGPRAIPSFTRALARGEAPVVHGDGLDVRDYVYVGDVAAAIVNACIGTPVRTINVGSGVGRTTLDVLRAVAAAMAVEAKPHFVPSTRHPSRLVLSTSRARQTLGFHPRPDFDVALGDEVQWLLDVGVDTPS